MELTFYSSLLNEIKKRVRVAQIKATLSANAEMITMYWDIGQMIYQRQQEEGWGAGVISRLAKDLKNELPEEKGFSERNLKFMTQFFKEFKRDLEIGKQPVSQLALDELVLSMPWGHIIILMQKIKSSETRIWYMQQTLMNGWNRDNLGIMIKSGLHLRQGNTTTNFVKTLPNQQSDLARQMLKDPYMFDFLTLTEPFTER